MLLSYVFFEHLHFPCIRTVNCKNKKTNLLAISIHLEVEALILLFKKTDLVVVLDL